MGEIERLPVRGEQSQAKALMQEGLIGCIEGSPPAWIESAGEVPPKARPWVEDLLSKQDTYRAGALAILCVGVASGETLDLRPFSKGVRGVGDFTKELLPRLKIPTTKGSPFETIAKGTDSYVGRARTAWNELLTWASTEASFEEVEAVAAHFVRRMAALRRDIPSMPELDTQRLTWARVVGVLDELLDVGSGGVYEQLIVAALVEALHADEVDLRERYVETKPVSASDASSRAPGDVQLRFPGGVVDEAIEVAGTAWEGKVPQAITSMRHHDLRSYLVLARAGLPDPQTVIDSVERGDVEAESFDVAVLDLRHEIRSMVRRLPKPTRRRFLGTLYRYLRQYQPDDSRVTDYVWALAAHGLTESRL